MQALGACPARVLGGLLRPNRVFAAGMVPNGLHAAQCVFTASEFAKSISLTVMTGDGRTYWDATFHKPVEAPAAASARPKKKSPARPIAGAGEEAFWTGDDRAGSLYVLARGTILRISVGGVTDEGERIRRSLVLAGYALQRLR